MDIFKILSSKTLFCIEYRLPVGSPVPVQSKQEPWIPAILAVSHSSGVTSQEHSFKGALIRKSGNYCSTLVSEPRFYGEVSVCLYFREGCFYICFFMYIQFDTLNLFLQIYTGCYDGSIQAVRLNLMQNYRCWVSITPDCRVARSWAGLQIFLQHLSLVICFMSLCFNGSGASFWTNTKNALLFY